MFHETPRWYPLVPIGELRLQYYIHWSNVLWGEVHKRNVQIERGDLFSANKLILVSRGKLSWQPAAEVFAESNKHETLTQCCFWASVVDGSPTLKHRLVHVSGLDIWYHIRRRGLIIYSSQFSILHFIGLLCMAGCLMDFWEIRCLIITSAAESMTKLHLSLN